MTADWGVEYRHASGATFVAPGWTETGARKMLHDCDGRCEPRPVRVMRRECGEWTEAAEGNVALLERSGIR